MFALIGLAIVLGAVFGGYLLEHGEMAVLMQPAEFLIIWGAGLGSLVIATPRGEPGRQSRDSPVSRLRLGFRPISGVAR